MPDLALIQSAISGLKTAGDIAKSFLELKSIADIQGKVIELQSAILAAQSSALAAQSDQASMAQRIRDLEEEVARVKEWAKQKQRYALHKFPSGAFAYALKPESADTEPVHYICAQCLNKGKKTILQEAPAEDLGTAMTCHECKVTIYESSYA
jgi:hypothetical protein